MIPTDHFVPSISRGVELGNLSWQFDFTSCGQTKTTEETKG